jgi:hypothetical protein
MLNGEKRQVKLDQPWIDNQKERGQKKRWIDDIKDLERLDITNWEELIKGRGSWSALTEAEKTLTES